MPGFFLSLDRAYSFSLLARKTPDTSRAFFGLHSVCGRSKMDATRRGSLDARHKKSPAAFSLFHSFTRPQGGSHCPKGNFTARSAISLVRRTNFTAASRGRAALPPLCKGRGTACGGGIVFRPLPDLTKRCFPSFTIPQSAPLTAPFTQGSQTGETAVWGERGIKYRRGSKPRGIIQLSPSRFAGAEAARRLARRMAL